MRRAWVVVSMQAAAVGLLLVILVLRLDDLGSAGQWALGLTAVAGGLLVADYAGLSGAVARRFGHDRRVALSWVFTLLLVTSIVLGWHAIDTATDAADSTGALLGHGLPKTWDYAAPLLALAALLLCIPLARSDIAELRSPVREDDGAPARLRFGALGIVLVLGGAVLAGLLVDNRVDAAAADHEIHREVRQAAERTDRSASGATTGIAWESEIPAEVTADSVLPVPGWNVVLVRRLISGWTGLVALDADDGTELWSYVDHRQGAGMVGVDPESGRVLIGYDDAAVVVDLTDGDRIAVLRPPGRGGGWRLISYQRADMAITGRYALAEYSSDYNAATRDGSVQLIDLEGERTRPLEDPPNPGCGYASIGSDERTLIVREGQGCGPPRVSLLHDDEPAGHLDIAPRESTDICDYGCDLEEIGTTGRTYLLRFTGLRTPDSAGELVTDLIEVSFDLQFEGRDILLQDGPVSFHPDDRRPTRVGFVYDHRGTAVRIVDVERRDQLADTDESASVLGGRHWYQLHYGTPSIVSVVDLQSEEPESPRTIELPCHVDGLTGVGGRVVAVCTGTESSRLVAIR